MSASEWNFDTLVGPTHNYAGLSYGNIASTSHRQHVAQPRTAALQGLEKMRLLHRRGIRQAILPPARRPHLELLRQLGFSGSDAELVDRAARTAPELLATVYSASSMWTANAATVSPSADCADGRLHFSVANLTSTLHRSIEAKDTLATLSAIFGDPKFFAVHPPLPCSMAMTDEGAANHTRLTAGDDRPGTEIFTYGRSAFGPQDTAKKYPARQTLEACQAVARRHGLSSERTFYIRQRPDAIDQGVFHNDVIAVGHQNVLLCHEHAWVDQREFLETLSEYFEDTFEQPLIVIEISDSQLTVAEAVASYLFNSQIITREDGGMILLCPSECEENHSAWATTQYILQHNNPIDEVLFIDLRESMKNGGGPACLRLRVVLNEQQVHAMHQGIIYSEALHERLEGWITDHYREQLKPEDLQDPQLIEESDRAQMVLRDILALPHVA